MTPEYVFERVMSKVEQDLPNAPDEVKIAYAKWLVAKIKPKLVELGTYYSSLGSKSFQ